MRCRVIETEDSKAWTSVGSGTQGQMMMVVSPDISIHSCTRD